ncbi:hypothetical protein BD410DRAFT_727011, partial [Rickenella mellea]
RPSAVSWWINRGRKDAVPPNVEVSKIKMQWWAWWNSIQPEWRRRGQDDLRSLSRAGVRGDWDGFWLPGVNGLLSVLICLVWWGREENASNTGSWISACQDVKCVVDAVHAEIRENPFVNLTISSKAN